uniref:Small ribosomal subunit protein uS19c n=1 Tax=Pteridomonas sp. YPF1301 TaxID=2766739 RepID=A0A7G1MS77_9STRA|nr:ribosomal protein S19 [Pteridomonas sp. YPF1301]
MIHVNFKSPFIYYKLLKKQNFIRTQKKNISIKTWSRNSTILPCMLNTLFILYNGKKHFPILISEYFIGHKLGEFVLTKNFYSHIKKDKKITHLNKENENN